MTQMNMPTQDQSNMGQLNTKYPHKIHTIRIKTKHLYLKTGTQYVQRYTPSPLRIKYGILFLNKRCTTRIVRMDIMSARYHFHGEVVLL